MPNYRTHSIHGETILTDIEKVIEIKDEDLKSFCMGPDALITTDYKVFDYQHANKVKEYFETMIKSFKKNKLYNDPESMAFLYGQIDHYVLDVVMHPLIYYVTEDMEAKLVYYRKFFLSNKKLKEAINKLYEKVYNSHHESLKYSIGILNTSLYDLLVRRNMMGIAPIIIKLSNMGNIMYDKNVERVLPYLNLNNKTWSDPETGEKYKDSFDDLWDKSIEDSLQTIEDINNYLYRDKALNNSFITNDLSFNTGRPCSEGQTLKYIRKYEKM